MTQPFNGTLLALRRRRHGWEGLRTLHYEKAARPSGHVPHGSLDERSSTEKTTVRAYTSGWQG